VCLKWIQTFHKAPPLLCLALRLIHYIINPHQMFPVRLLQVLVIVVQLDALVKIILHPLTNRFCYTLLRNIHRQVTNQPLTDSHWTLLTNLNYWAIFMIYVPLKICLICYSQRPHDTIPRLRSVICYFKICWVVLIGMGWKRWIFHIHVWSLYKYDSLWRQTQARNDVKNEVTVQIRVYGNQQLAPKFEKILNFERQFLLVL
jgi:hypothetical protein